MKALLIAVLGIVATFAFCGLALNLIPQREDGRTPEQKRLARWESNDAKRDAFRISQQFVTKRFKAPATAEFPGSDHAAVAVVHQGEGLFLVKGYVDAENAFGAKLRSSFLCELTESGGEWESKSVLIE